MNEEQKIAAAVAAEREACAKQAAAHAHPSWTVATGAGFRVGWEQCAASIALALEARGHQPVTIEGIESDNGGSAYRKEGL